MAESEKRKSDDVVWAAANARAAFNLRETSHPFHHRTVDGTIVTPDPTLEYLLGRLSAEQRRRFYEDRARTPEEEAQAPKAVPVNRAIYKGLV